MASDAVARNDLQTQPGLRAMKSAPIGHIYYNLATGERVVTPFESRPRSGGIPRWISNNSDPCATGGVVGVIDDPDLDGDGNSDVFGAPCVGGTFPCEGSWHSFWGDIAFNCVVDCVVTAYGILAPDLDTDSDSLGDGIVGYDMSLTFSDNDNGFGADLPGISGRSCIIDLTIPTLAGAVGAIPPGSIPVYILTLDLASATPSLVFELGDDDGVDDSCGGNSGGAIYGHPTGVDKDTDGLADFSFAIRFDQSTLGTDGTPGATKGANAYVTVAPKLGNPGDLPADPADATGLFDAVDIYSTGPQCAAFALPGNPLYIGAFFFGGFTCAPGVETPYSSAFLELYGPHRGGCSLDCQANFDGSALPANFTDVLTFLADFGTACTDGIGNFDGSTGGVPNDCNFSDVIAFLTNFSSTDCGNAP